MFTTGKSVYWKVLGEVSHLQNSDATLNERTAPTSNWDDGGWTKSTADCTHLGVFLPDHLPSEEAIQHG